MKLDVLCSSSSHPVRSHLESWAQRRRTEHIVRLIQKVSEATGGDMLFLISCSELVPSEVRSRYRYTLVIHASNLPEGRGWSPLVWQVLEGRSEITVTLFEAVDAVDAGPIWKKTVISLEPHELYDEIHSKLFRAEIELMDFAVDHAGKVNPVPQDAASVTYYRKRTPEDSRIDPARSIAEQFNLLRIADPDRYPAFFEIYGYRYSITLRKMGRVKNTA